MQDDENKSGDCKYYIMNPVYEKQKGEFYHDPRINCGTCDHFKEGLGCKEHKNIMDRFKK
jgi:hypothetical protein